MRPSRLRNALVVVQVTACVLLLVSAGVLLRGSRRLQHLDPGLRTKDVVQLSVQEQRRGRLLTQLAAEPLVERVGATTSGVLDGEFPLVPVTGDARGKVVRAGYDLASGDYFRVLDISILQGRNFSPDEEREARPVVIVSETAARLLWPDRDPVGETLHLALDPGLMRGTRLAPFVDSHVIGVARDAAAGALVFGRERPVAYFPTTVAASRARLVVRVKGDVEAARHALEGDLERLVPGGVEQMHTMQQFLAGQVYPIRLAFWVSQAVGALAVLLTVSGVYGVLSYVVSQRAKDFGIRMALGASARWLVVGVLGQSLRLAIVGTAIGVVLGLGLSRLLASALAAGVRNPVVNPVVNAFDVGGYVGGALAVVLACLLAAYAPSRRVALIDPALTLRQE